MSAASAEARRKGWSEGGFGVWVKDGEGKIYRDIRGWTAVSEDENEVQFRNTLTECIRFFEGEQHGN